MRFGIKLWTVMLALFVTAGLAFGAGTIQGNVNLPGDHTKSVVYIKKVEGNYSPESGVMVDQKDLKFVPHIQPVLKGTKVIFKNSDSVVHNVFTPPNTGDFFSLIFPKQGQTGSHVFRKPGVYPLLCSQHQEMEAYVIVLQNPYFAVTDKSGNFTIDNVPAGTYTADLWNENFKSGKVLSKQVMVPASGTVQLNFNAENRVPVK